MSTSTNGPLSPAHGAAVRLTLLLLLTASALTIAPLWVALTLAIWFAVLARPLLLRVARWLRGRNAAAAVITMLLVLLIVTPLLLAGISLATGAVSLVKRALNTPSGKSALAAIVSDHAEGIEWLDLLRQQDLFGLIQEHGARAWQVLQAVAGATVGAVLSGFIFVLGGYTFLVSGPHAYRWAEAHAPLHPTHFRRLAGAFVETGRGLLIGVGLTALIQGLLATGAYLALGIPSAATLGLLTCLASLVPSFGTALVWVPVAAGLAITGRPIKAAILAGIGVLVISTVDNLLRPYLSKYGRLRLPTFALFVGIFGGLSAFGPWGFVLGPLLVRLTVEILEIYREETSSAQGAQGAQAE